MNEESTIVLGPAQVGSVQQLRPETSQEIKLTPETEVLCIHRGRTPIEDTFDSKHYIIEPGYFTIQLGAARHFKARAVVPGSRNPELGKYSQASFIAIIGVAVPTATGLKVQKVVDAPEEWAPFTDAECASFGLALEAIDRGALTDAIDSDVQLMDVAGGQITGPAKSRVKAAGGTGRSRSATRIEGPGVAALAQKNAPGENETTRAIAAATAGSPADLTTDGEPDAPPAKAAPAKPKRKH